MKLVVFALLVLVGVALGQHDHGSEANTQYNRCKNIKGFAKIEWRISTEFNNVTMKISFENAGRGWGGIGFNDAGKGMDGASMIVSHGNCDIFGCNLFEYSGRDLKQPLPENRTLVQGQVSMHMQHLNVQFMRRLTHPVYTISNKTISLLLAFNNNTRPHGNMHMFRKHSAYTMFDVNLFDHSHCMSNSMNHNMKMYFHFDVMNFVLFKFWHTHEPIGFTLSCFACFAFAIINQILFFVVRYRPISDSKLSEYEEMEGSVQVESLPKKVLKNPYFWYVVKPIAFVFQITLGYFIMLIVMSYNAGFLISIVVGSVIGWSLFSLRNNVEPEECCN